MASMDSYGQIWVAKGRYGKIIEDMADVGGYGQLWGASSSYG